MILYRQLNGLNLKGQNNDPRLKSKKPHNRFIMILPNLIDIQYVLYVINFTLLYKGKKTYNNCGTALAIGVGTYIPAVHTR